MLAGKYDLIRHEVQSTEELHEHRVSTGWRLEEDA